MTTKNERTPEWVQAGDNTLHGAIDHWQNEAARLKADNDALRAELESTENLAIKQGDMLNAIVNITKGEPGELARHSTHDAFESVEALRVERDQATEAWKKLTDGVPMGEIAGMHTIANMDREIKRLTVDRDELAAKVERLSGQMALIREMPKEHPVDTPILREAENSLTETPAQSLAHIKAQGAREAVDKCAWYTNRTFIRIDEINRVIADMENNNESA